MKKKLVLLVLFAISVALMSGCTTGGSFLAQNVTSVELSNSNFKFVARNLQGFSQADYLIGLSYSTGFMANTLALVRIGGSEKLYDDAVQDLWKNYSEKHGDMAGKKLVLVNLRYDTDILNLVVYTQTKLFVSADVVEFVE